MPKMTLYEVPVSHIQNVVHPQKGQKMYLMNVSLDSKCINETQLYIPSQFDCIERT